MEMVDLDSEQTMVVLAYCMWKLFVHAKVLGRLHHYVKKKKVIFLFYVLLSFTAIFSSRLQVLKNIKQYLSIVLFMECEMLLRRGHLAIFGYQWDR